MLAFAKILERTLVIAASAAIVESEHQFWAWFQKNWTCVLSFLGTQGWLLDDWTDCFHSGSTPKGGPCFACWPTQSYTFYWGYVCRSDAGRGAHSVLCTGPVFKENQS